MSFKSQTYYGYKINSNLSDVVDPSAALEELNLNVDDLDIIKDAASKNGATREDLVAISELNVPLYKTLDRYIGETGEYNKILSSSSGIDSALRGNLLVNGVVGGSAIRFKFLEYTRKLNCSSVPLTLKLNERLTDTIDANTTGIVKEIGTNYVIIRDITGGPFVNGRTFTGSYSGASFVSTSSINTTIAKFADISTSRVSAWSTATSTPVASTPIFYNKEIKIVTGGKISVDTLTFGGRAIERLKQRNGQYITGEFATHTITVNVNNVDYKLYVMKSIPLIFRGDLNYFSCTVRFNQVNPASPSRVSWRVVDVLNPNSAPFTSPERGSLSESSLTYYQGSTKRLRDIEIYYQPSFITQLILPNSYISVLPNTQLTALNLLNISNNLLIEMPNIKYLAPNLLELYIGKNDLFKTSNVSLQKLTKEVADRLPNSLTLLNINSTYDGSIRCVDSSGNLLTATTGPNAIGGPNSYSVIEKACDKLITFDINKTGTPFFKADDYDLKAHLPSMPSTLVSYSAQGNQFTAVPARGVKDLPNLVTFNVYGNSILSDPGFSLDSPVIENVTISFTLLPVPNLSLRPKLTNFTSAHNGNPTTLFSNDNDADYKFSSCGALQTLELSNSSGITGFIPKFKGNTNLRTVNLFNTNVAGGRPDNGEHGYTDGKTYVMYKDTFVDCPNIQSFTVFSTKLLTGKGFEPDTFKNLGSLRTLYWVSNGRTGLGGGVELPDLSSCPSLQRLDMQNNNFEGSIPSVFPNNISYIDVSNNKLTGPIPTFNGRSRLSILRLNNNNLTQFDGFRSTNNLTQVYIQNNQITGKIPTLGERVNSPNIVIFNASNNQFDSYEPGSFAKLTRLNSLDISLNRLTAFDINNIIDDLFTNYNLSPRIKVTINLRGQSNAVAYVPTSSGSTREQDVARKIAFLTNTVGNKAPRWTIRIG
jgi:Leucine-rich repeat (LRR) protein